MDASRERLQDDSFKNTHCLSEEAPPTFTEDPIIRDVYIDVYLAATFHHISLKEAQFMLDSLHRTLVALSKRPGVELQGLDAMARTLPDVCRRLGLDPGQHAVYYFLCDICWTRHQPSELYQLETSGCTRPGCSGVLFVTKQIDGRTERIPLKILPVASSIGD
ncbi:uncharacterized protein B0H18DRAFT_1117141 [Fomitopsis serialis]|uniref:uncharacterized protein n=1 Tax=Fomitopsis serialis TaxID=139415 RepID=UPI002007541E|nr:uncharacterized protein B0H18DRAFT_1117141 [Neoantrodia serialis]KAH9930078.1 hypothetical protein B0H18DRAFT_1117141 [Neoantrodia serialis]